MLVLSRIKILEDRLEKNSLIPDDLLNLSKISSQHFLLLRGEVGFTLNSFHVAGSFGFIEELLIDEGAELVVVEEAWEVGFVLLEEFLDVLFEEMDAEDD